MSRVCKCIDNGPMEGFWGTLKSEAFCGLVKKIPQLKKYIIKICDRGIDKLLIN